MPSLSSLALSGIFHALPSRMARHLQHRLMRQIPDELSWMYERAPLRLAPGMSLRVPKSRDVMYDQIALFGLYENRLSKICAAVGRRGGTMIDVGANVGYFSCLFLAQNPANRVIALEPSKRTFALLLDNLQMNGVANRASAHNAAASVRRELRSFVEPVDATGWGRFGREEPNEREDASDQVACFPLDELVAPTTSVDFLKIDVEGGESLVLRGATRMLTKKQIKKIYIEVNRPGAASIGLNPEDALTFLSDHGYKPQRMGPARPIEDWLAEPA